jgi:hypothetical protein
MTWIVKDSNGKYYKFSEDAVHWHDEQRKAHRFKTKEEAENLSKHMNSQYSESRVVKLKVCQDLETKQLEHPKQGTVFLDLTMPSPESNIVTCVYEDRHPEFADDCFEYVCTTNSYSPKEDTWGTLDEYHQYLKEGKIKVIWEPKP